MKNKFKMNMKWPIACLFAVAVVACSDKLQSDDAHKAVSDGVRFSLNDVQDAPEVSLAKTAPAKAYAFHRIAIEGADDPTLYIKETTVEGVNPVQHNTSSTRTALQTSITQDFSLFADIPTATSPGVIYNGKVNRLGVPYAAFPLSSIGASGLKFYAFSPYLAPGLTNVTLTPATHGSTAPVISYTLPQDARQHVDLLAAQTGVITQAAAMANDVPLTFKHILTAVNLKVGKDLSYNQKIKKVEFKGIITKGDYDLVSDQWTLGTVRGDAVLDQTSNPISTKKGVGTVLTSDEQTFLMIPQTLPHGAQLVITFESGKVITANISGKIWAQGTTKFYKVGKDDVTDWNYDLHVSVDQPIVENGDVNRTFKVTSYRRLKEYGSNDRDKAEPWTIDGYSLDGGASWSNVKPAMLQIIDHSGQGGSSAEVKTFKLNKDVVNKLQERIDAMKQATPASNKDLSLTASGKRSTANCYIISAPGTYSFPLVYGNAIKDNNKNMEAYRPGAGTAVVSSAGQTPQARGTMLATFEGGAGAIPLDGYIKGVTGAEVLWESTSGLVQNIQFHGGNPGSITFSVAQDKLTVGNAIVAVKKGNNILWSWHLWFTSADIMDVNSNRFMLEPLGYTDNTWMVSSYTGSRTLMIKVKQTRSGKTDVFSITQNGYNKREGKLMYYQQGRKDPFPVTENMQVQADGMDLKTAAQKPMTLAAFASKGGYAHWDWCKAPSSNQQAYYNLWSAKNKWNVNKGRNPANTASDNQNYTAVIKTVYDPCPVGFHVPKHDDFQYLGQAQKNDGTKAFRPGLGAIEINTSSKQAAFTNLSGQGWPMGYYWSVDKNWTESVSPGIGSSFKGFLGTIAMVSNVDSQSQSFSNYGFGVGDEPTGLMPFWACAIMPIKE